MIAYAAQQELLSEKNHKKKQARDFFDLRNCSAKQPVLKRMRQPGCVQCATPTSCVYCETKSSWRMLPTQYMQTFVKHTSDASTKERVQLSILWNNNHANGAQLRKFATREPHCCETSVVTLAAVENCGSPWQNFAIPASTTPEYLPTDRPHPSWHPSFQFWFWILRDSSPNLLVACSSPPSNTEPEDELEAARVAINNIVTVLYLFTVPISSELFFAQHVHR